MPHLQLISADEAARRLAISVVTLWRLRRADPDFPVAVRVGKRRIAFREDEIDRFVEAGGAR
jgi:predicted DNA-binding transcriptional regulator AlpA